MLLETGLNWAGTSCRNLLGAISAHPQGVLSNKEVGGLGPHIKFGGKIWGKVRPSSQNRRKNLGSPVTKKHESWEQVPILGSYLKFRGQNLGYLSFIFLEAKFGAPTRISEAKFGAKPPDLLIWKYPLGAHQPNILLNLLLAKYSAGSSAKYFAVEAL